jgi:hypothetical protein
MLAQTAPYAILVAVLACLAGAAAAESTVVLHGAGASFPDLVYQVEHHI